VPHPIAPDAAGSGGRVLTYGAARPNNAPQPGRPRCMMNANTLWLLLFSVMLAGGQLLFKRAAQAITGLPVQRLLPVLAATPAMWAAVTLYGGATLLWVWILSRVPLSQAHPWVALGVVVVPLAAVLVFGETVRPVFWLGAALIVAGIVLTQVGSGG